MRTLTLSGLAFTPPPPPLPSPPRRQWPERLLPTAALLQRNWLGGSQLNRAEPGVKARSIYVRLTPKFLLKNITVPTRVLVWLSSHLLISDSYISVFTSGHGIKEKLSLPSTHLKLE